MAHTLILKDSQVLFTEDWQKKTNSPSITTGNELKGEEIAEFSAKLDVRALYDYCRAVMDSTNELLKASSSLLTEPVSMIRSLSSSVNFLFRSLYCR